MQHEEFEHQNVANTTENERFQLQNVANTVEMAASNSKMHQNAANSKKSAEKTDLKKTKRKNHNSQNNSGPSINQALFHGMGKQSIFHPLHLNQEPPGTQPPPPTTPAPPMSVSRADGAVGTEGNTRNHLCNWWVVGGLKDFSVLKTQLKIWDTNFILIYWGQTTDRSNKPEILKRSVMRCWDLMRSRQMGPLASVGEDRSLDVCGDGSKPIITIFWGIIIRTIQYIAQLF